MASTRKRHGRFTTALAAAVAMFVSTGTPVDAADKRAVLELFTSQGCSSCPPADALLQKFAADNDLLALSFPVDYWDYLGWKDTLASRDNTERQYAYAKRRGDRSVYTPQVIINGREHAVGSDRRAIMKSIKEQADASGGALTVDVNLDVSGESVRVTLGDAVKKVPKARVWLVFYNSQETVAIGRGENRGTTITYTNIVRDMVSLGTWQGDALTFEKARADLTGKSDYDHCVVIVQRDERGLPGAIIGASDPRPVTNPS
ncbi:MAG: DUF1223 domain-containing protein [Pseudomonadota bacterium]